MASKIYIGDSLGVVTDNYLRGVKSNSRQNRASAEGVTVLKSMLTTQTRKVYFDLGTNDGSASSLEGSIKKVRRMIGNRELFMSTLRGPAASSKNAMLRGLRDDGDITLVNLSSINPGSDGIHLSVAGYRKKAQIIMAAFGSDGATSVSVSGNTTTTSTNLPYKFKRGERNGKREGSWEAITRMATEVNWRAFMLKDTLCFIAENDPSKTEMDLFRGAIYTTIDPKDERMYSYSGEVDVNKKSSEFNFTYLADRWAFTPGSVVRLQGFSGAYNGRWLVASTRRDYFNPVAEVTLKRPSPSKPEPANEVRTETQTIEDQHNSGSSSGGGSTIFDKVYNEAVRIHNQPRPYLWGGGHGGFGSSGGLDCSGYVSYALHAGGILDTPLTSGSLASWGEPGAGKRFTVYANNGHVFMHFYGNRKFKRADTSDGYGGGGGKGPNCRTNHRPTAGFSARHWRGE